MGDYCDGELQLAIEAGEEERLRLLPEGAECKLDREEMRFRADS